MLQRAVLQLPGALSRAAAGALPAASQALGVLPTAAFSSSRWVTLGDTARSLIAATQPQATDAAGASTNTSSSHQHGATLPGQAQQQQGLLAQRLFPPPPRHTPTLHRYVHTSCSATHATVVTQHACLCGCLLAVGDHPAPSRPLCAAGPHRPHTQVHHCLPV